MKLRTELEIKPSEFKITHNSHILGIGSCFVKETGDRLSAAKFDVMVNPFGTLFHPQAIENALMRILSLSYYSSDEIFNHGELFFSWDHHTSFSRTSAKETLLHINSELEKANDFLQKTDCVILTFGTAWIYKIKDTGLFVANCHKVPSAVFEKHLLTEKQIISSIKNCFDLIYDINPNAHIIATVSPVRHTRDGIVENSLSKAKLISALHQLTGHYKNVEYFPAFELLNDDLRDYRFYADDLIHPNQMAVNYIWQKFSSAYFDENTMKKIEAVNKIKSALEHLPLNSKTIAYREFLFKTNKLINETERNFLPGSFLAEKNRIKELEKLC